MPSPLGGATGERMELAAYYADFEENYARASEFWKLERGQVYAEPGNDSWEAFDSGHWEESLRLMEKRKEELAEKYRDNAARGMTGRRVRIVALPPSTYLQWELYFLMARAEAGDLIRILLASDVTDLEDQGPLPDIYTIDTDVMYQAIYDDNGVLDHALRYTDRALVVRCRDLIASLYGHGEPIKEFCQREIVHLPAPRPGHQAISRDYLEQTGRPLPIRS